MSETEPTAVTIVRESDKAYLFKHEEHGEAWFPKKEVSFKRRLPDNTAVAEIPLWLLQAKGW